VHYRLCKGKGGLGEISFKLILVQRVLLISSYVLPAGSRIYLQVEIAKCTVTFPVLIGSSHWMLIHLTHNGSFFESISSKHYT